MSKKTPRQKHVSIKGVIRVFNWVNMSLPKEAQLPKMVSVHGLAKLSHAFNELGGRLESASAQQRHREQEPEPRAIDEKALAAIATNAWRAKIKMVDSDTGEAKEDMRRVYRHIESIFESLKSIGIEAIDPIGRAYDSGMALKVISFEQTPGLSKEEIKETVKPSVTWQRRLIQVGEVIVGTPLS